MKKRLTKFFGVALTAALLVGLFITGAPVAAKVQAWSEFDLPSDDGQVVGDGNIGLFTYNSDGSVIYAAINTGGAGGRIVMSDDDGRTWEDTDLTHVADGGLIGANGGAGYVMDIETSINNPNHVYVTDGYDIFKTEDGGDTWAVLSNVFNSGVGATGNITSIDVGFLGSNPYIFAACSDFGGLGVGGVFVAQEAVFGIPWSNMEVDTDRANPGDWTDADMDLVMVDPAFATTQMVMAAGWNGTDLVLTTKYVGQQWGQTADDLEVDSGNITTALYNANVALPSSFSSTVGTGEMRAYLGVNDIGGPGAGDVFLCVFGPAGADTSSATDLNVRGFGTPFQVTGLDMVGTFLLASGVNPTAPTVPLVYRSTDAASDGATFTAAIKNPAGAAGPIFFASSSLLITDAENGEAICGTFGTNSGVYLTQNFGATWNGMSQLAAGVGTISDLEFVGDTVYVVDGDTIWRHDGQWLRLADDAYLGINATCLVAAPNGDLFVFEEGTTNQISRSTDMGDTWTPQISPLPAGNVMEVVPLSSTNLVAANDLGEIFTTTNNGVLWFEREDGLAGTPVAYDTFGDSTEILLGTDAGEVWWSGDSGMTWEDLDFGGTGSVFPVFGTKYGDDAFIYATDSDGGVFQTDATDPDWEAIDIPYGGASAPSGASTAEAAVVAGAGIGAGTGGPQGMIYATDSSEDDVMRFKCRETQTVDQAEVIDGPGGDIDGMWLTPGSNVLWVIVDGTEIHTYTDVLGVFGSGVAVTYTTASATITWDALDEVDTYRVTLGTAAIGGGTGGVHGSQDHANAFATIETANTTATFTGLTSATTYYVKVWGILPVSTFHFQGESSFATLPSAPVYTPNLMPPDGAYNVPTTVAFAWDPVSGATSYEWQLATDSGYTNIIATMSPTVPHLVYGPLDNSTSFFWRVRAVTDAGTSSWVSSVFSTEDADDPPVTVTQTSTTTTEVTEEITPMYIWVIIIIGAILTVAVIILIVRTRRVV